MWIVFDWAKTKAFGPFDNKEAAQDWLAKQGILLGQYEDQEVGLMELHSTSEVLETI